MPETLTIAYMTNRKHPRIEWFWDSFHRECQGNYEGIKFVVVDYWCGKRPILGPKAHVPYLHLPPKPNVWQGKYRLTKRDYFAAANARNTAICCAPDGYIVFVDDLSVLVPGWLAAVREAIAGNYIVCGAYKKKSQLTVSPEGELAWVDRPPNDKGAIPGEDNRLAHTQGEPPMRCGGQWLFGCSFGAPVEALLDVNGLDEDCDSMGSEDYILGLMLERLGYPIYYDWRMMTYEHDEAHGEEEPFLRIIKAKAANSNFGEIDASHTILNMVVGGRNRAPNYFGEGGIRAVRQRILDRTGTFPVTQVPEHHWCDGQPLREM